MHTLPPQARRAAVRQALGNGRRIYDPSLMRFLSPDDLSPFDRGGINAYAYCEGDPVDRADPTGRFYFDYTKLVPLLTGVIGLTGGIGLAVASKNDAQRGLAIVASVAGIALIGIGARMVWTAGKQGPATAPPPKELPHLRSQGTQTDFPPAYGKQRTSASLPLSPVAGRRSTAQTNSPQPDRLATQVHKKRMAPQPTEEQLYRDRQMRQRKRLHEQQDREYAQLQALQSGGSPSGMANKVRGVRGPDRVLALF